MDEEGRNHQERSALARVGDRERGSADHHD